MGAPRRCLAAAAWAAGGALLAADVVWGGPAADACAGDACAGGDPVGLLQVHVARGAAGGGLETPGAQSEEAAAKLASKRKADAIEEAFAGVRGHGGYFNPGDRLAYVDEAFAGLDGKDGGTIPGEPKQDATWAECGKLNWTDVSKKAGEGLHVPSVNDMLGELRLDSCFNENSTWNEDPTCVSVRAALKATFEMQSKFPEGPRFANYSVVAWGEYPSWVVGAVSGLDYSGEMPPKASLDDPNGVAGYGVCDVLRTVLTQSADQMQTSTCSWVASLAALSHKAPAIAIKIGMRLLWSGRITKDADLACPGIFVQQPGLIPFYDDSTQQWTPDWFSASGTPGCSGNAADCAKGMGKPSQNAGLTFMWAQAFVSTWVASNLNSCPRNPGEARAGLAYPGMTSEETKAAQRHQGGSFGSMLWSCGVVMDPEGGSCRPAFNKNLCSFLSDDDCVKKIRMTPEGVSFNELIAPLFTKYSSEAFERGLTTGVERDAYSLPKARDALAGKPRMAQYLDLLLEISNSTQRPAVDVMSVQDPTLPSFTRALLNETCEAYTNLLLIDSAILQPEDTLAPLRAKRVPFFGNFDGVNAKSAGCDHAVYLAKCDHEKNEYHIWSWGTTFALSAEMIVGWPTDQPGAPETREIGTYNTGCICGAVLADQISAS